MVATPIQEDYAVNNATPATPNHAAANGGGPTWLQSVRLVAAVAELGALFVTKRTMKTIAFITLFFVQLFSAVAAPRPHTNPVFIAAVQQLKAPITIEAVERVFGPSVAQPGPRVSYPSADHKGMSLWFWIEAPQHRDMTNKAKWTVGCVILATTVTEEKRKVVWPLSAVNEPPETLIRRVNDTYGKNK